MRVFANRPFELASGFFAAGALEYARALLVKSWGVLGEMAPYLLLGFLVAGVLAVLIPPEWVERHLGRPGFRPVLLASLLGVPLPLCSCGVIPVAASMRRHGASRAATTSFLLSTPQTGVDSIAITYALLGPVVAVFRPIAALITGLLGGGLVQWLGERDPTTAGANGDKNGDKNGGKIGSKNELANGGGAAACTQPCCAERGSGHRLGRALHYGFITLPRDIGGALLLGVVIAGAISAFTSADVLKPYLGQGIGAMLLMVVAGIPLYVCASGSVPIAAGFIFLGASPGAALAFLIAGPATNAATITTIWKVLGRRTALLYLATIVVAAVGCGLLLDSVFGWLHTSLPSLGAHNHASGAGGWSGHVWAVLLLGVLLVSYSWPTGARASSTTPTVEHAHDTTVACGAAACAAGEPCNAMDRCETNDATAAAATSAGRDSPATRPVAAQVVQLEIRGMTCSHCAESVRRALAETAGVQAVEVTLRPPRAMVRGTNLAAAELTAAIESLGYQAEPRGTA